MNAFKEAIEALVPVGGRVLELGGGTGALSFFAAQRAARVWCVERNPELVSNARGILPLNPGAERIELVEADALEYLPPEPVDVVICEMLHAGLLEEKQVPVLASFKRRYAAEFAKLPVFLPEAAVLGIQPVEQKFDFAGFLAPVPLFQDPLAVQESTRDLGSPAAWSTIDYAGDFPESCAWDGLLPVTGSGSLNALRFITKNILAVVIARGRTIDWHNHYLVVPLSAPVPVKAGDRLRVRFAYQFGAPLADLVASLQVEKA
jgi:type I protein arginine methyltransferase